MPVAHIVLALLVNAAWGCNFIAVKVGLGEMEPFLFSALRFSVMLLLLSPWLKWHTGQMRLVLLAALCGGPVHFGAIFLGLDLMGEATPAALLTQLSVPFSTLLAVIFLGERVGIWRVAGLALSFTGLAIMAFDPAMFRSVDGMLVMILSQLAYSGSAILMRQIKGVSVLQMQAWMALVSAPGLILVSLAFEHGQMDQLAGLSLAGILALLYTVFGSSIFGHGGIYYLYQRHPVSSIMPFFLVSPIVGVAAAVAFLGEALTARMVIGGLVIFSGVALVIFRERWRAKHARV